MGRVTGKVALVTGAAVGIGRACAERLAAEGAAVVLTDVDDINGQAACDAIINAGGNATYLHQDVTREDEWLAIIEQISQLHGRLDVLVNNAGIAVMKSTFDISMEEYQLQNAINIDGVFLGLRCAIPLMAETGGGSAINLSSIAGLRGAGGLSAYSMTKGAVRLLSRSVARECAAAGNGVRVNSVHPGIIDTAIWDKMGMAAHQGNNQTDIDIVAATVPGGKAGKPEDIANGVLYLASDESSYVNGSELVIDNALTA